MYVNYVRFLYVTALRHDSMYSNVLVNDKQLLEVALNLSLCTLRPSIKM